MINQIFQQLNSIITAFSETLAGLFQNIVNIFYTPGAGDTQGTLTFVGVLTLVGVGTGLVVWAFNFIRGLLGKIGNR